MKVNGNWSVGVFVRPVERRNELIFLIAGLVDGIRSQMKEEIYYKQHYSPSKEAGVATDLRGIQERFGSKELILVE